MDGYPERANVLRSLFPEVGGEELNLVPEVETKDICTYIKRRSPFVFRQAPIANIARPHFSFEHLAAFLGNKEIVVEHKYRWEKQTQTTTLGEYIRDIGKTEYYWRQGDISGLGVAIPPFPVLHRRTDTIWFDLAWVGPCGTVQTFHQDNRDELIVNSNALMQMQGVKYAALAAPEDSELLEAESFVIPGHKKLSLASPFDAHLRKAATSLYHAVLLPGDLLFIPERWWHFLQSVTPSVSISRWWFDKRMAETLYMAANAPTAPFGATLDFSDWHSDLTEFGGRDVLVEFLAQFTIQQQRIMLLGLVKRYGPGVHLELGLLS